MWLWLKSRVSLEQAEVGNGLREWLGGEDRTRLCRLLGTARKPSSRGSACTALVRTRLRQQKQGSVARLPFRGGFCAGAGSGSLREETRERCCPPLSSPGYPR